MTCETKSRQFTAADIKETSQLLRSCEKPLENIFLFVFMMLMKVLIHSQRKVVSSLHKKRIRRTVSTFPGFYYGLSTMDYGLAS